MAATDEAMSVMASLGGIAAVPSDFQRPCESITHGGVLLALPALIAAGLLRHSARFFTLPAGFYGLEHIFMLLGMLALCRIKSIEQLRSTAPGEWGKLLGLDRCPEAKTLRAKIKILTADGNGKGWSAQLCDDWMAANPASTATLYIDGHARVYHGHLTKLPRHYIARERLCLRATTDYWVNGLDGLPFFKINQAVDPGLIRTLEEQIVPELEPLVPDQPTQIQLDADPLRMRFRLIFDREGYSPGFFKRMAAKRIACQTYHKHPAKDWPGNEFSTRQVPLMIGGHADMLLAERGTLIGSDKNDQLWVREIRKLDADGHQVAIISTEWRASAVQIAGPQFGRWYQENFFKYGREHFNLDRQIDYQLEKVDDTTRLVNPAWRKLDGEVRKRVATQHRRKARLHDLGISGQLEPAKAEHYMRCATTLRADIEREEAALDKLKKKRKDTTKHLTFAELPEADRFLKLATRSKYFIDTIKMIAYRAETAMSHIVRERLNAHHQDEARALIRDLCTTPADLVPDQQTKTLTITLHSLATPKNNAAVAHLCAELNATETLYPGTELRMVFKSVSP
ncbi:MAG: hypothetical protein K9N23_00920 [Akkermansiaceae bacterium]|nr:hypothetical protein [Akkermansiaceae bacterium]